MYKKSKFVPLIFVYHFPQIKLKTKQNISVPGNYSQPENSTRPWHITVNGVPNQVVKVFANPAASGASVSHGGIFEVRRDGAVVLLPHRIPPRFALGCYFLKGFSKFYLTWNHYGKWKSTIRNEPFVNFFRKIWIRKIFTSQTFST